MSHYTFLNWLRQGIVNQIKENDRDSTVKLRASVNFQVKASSDNGSSVTVNRNVRLVGPGDVVGIDPRAVIRTEPRHRTTNFEPNYLPLIEFYDEDMPWRYTPVKADTSTPRLRPWITLVVLEEHEEFEENPGSQPLPGFRLRKDPGLVFQSAGELWAWAHVHANENLGEAAGNGMTAVLNGMDSLIRNNPDRAYSRLMCPRKLKKNTSYHAFVIPSFEPGRLAGLGLEPSEDVFATLSAWESYAGRPATELYPYYYRWFFKTGEEVDFEYLVRLLKPEAIDKRVGTRPMDVSDPQGGIDPDTISPARQVTLLEGALLSPTSDHSPFFTPDDLAFRKQLLDILDFPEKNRLTAPTGDPIITPPIYGQWHALTPMLDQPTGNDWLHQLNLDPRWRAAAGLGAKVIRENQEKYMELAWKQVEGIIEANRKLNQVKFATEALTEVFAKNLATLDAPVGLLTLKSLHSKVLIGNPGAAQMTARALIEKSPLQKSAVSNAFKKIIRPRGAVADNSRPNKADALRPGSIIGQINDQKITAAPVKLAAPPFLFSLEKAAAELQRLPESPAANDFLRPDRFSVLKVNDIRKNPGFVIISPVRAPVIADSGTVVANPTIPAITDPSVRVVTNPDRSTVVTEPTIPVIIRSGGSVANPSIGGAGRPDVDRETADAVAFKAALQKQYLLFEASANVTPAVSMTAVHVGNVYNQLLQKITPQLTLARRTKEILQLSPYYQSQMTGNVRPVMAYPEIPQAMYEPLRDLSGEFLIPNLKLIQNNVISLLTVNQEFIEAYLTGLNHEFARELLWREFPTDQRGSYFRQFWDVREALGATPTPARINALKDIPEIHRWPAASQLGDHNNRPTVKDNVVLVVRGELLKRYPNTVIYAQKAKWPLKNGNVIDHSVARDLEDESNPDNIRNPLFKAQILPDVYFIGFDLDIPTVKGETDATSPSQNPGWFFILKERPGEPRFGFDIGGTPNTSFFTWNELEWSDIGTADGSGIALNRSFSLAPPTPVSIAANDPQRDEKERHNEDLKHFWNNTTDSADIAYIAYQDKVMVAIHGSEMLGDLATN